MRYLILLFLATNVSAAILSNDQISCTITANGIQAISLGGRIVTTRPSAWCPAQGFHTFAGVPPAPVSEPVLHSALAGTPDAVTVTDALSNMSIEYVYRLSGSDIEMEAILKNNDTRPFNHVSLVLPTFAFGPKAKGNINCWNTDYLEVNPGAAFHPGVWSPLAVSYARDENYGLALHCKSHFDKQSVFTTLRASGTSGVPPAVADVTLHLQDCVQPGNQLAVDVTIHLSAKTDLASVLSSYVRDFQKFAGPMQYLPDDRPWLRFSAIDSTFVTRQDPLGYYGDNRRFDLPGGIIRFEDMIWPCVGVTQGTIFWQPQGYNPRGCQYRPDFDVWPDSVSANLPKLIAWYRANGMKFGLCARPADIITPAGPNSDQTCHLDVDEPSQMAMLIARFDAVAKLGVNAFYLDSFGTDLNSYHIMKQLRAHLGNAVPTYSEYTSDLMLPYSGVYTEMSPAWEEGKVPDGSVRWYDAETIQVFRLLYPQSTIMTTRIDNGAGHFHVSTRQLAAWKLTPLVEDYQARQCRVFFQELIANHMSGNLWK